MDKLIEALSKAGGRLVDSLDRYHLPLWGKLIAIIVLIAIVVMLSASVVSLIKEFVDKGVFNYQGGAMVAGTYFTGVIVTVIYGMIRLLIDKDGNGIADALEKEDKRL